MIPTITASAETLASQAPKTAADYMAAAVRHIDTQFGAGYAKSNPALVAAFMQTCAQDFHTAVSTSVMQQLYGSVTAVSDSVDRIATAIADLDIG